MQIIHDTHQQFAEFFPGQSIKPFAYLVSRKLSEGHICLDLDDVEKELAENVFYDQHKVVNHIKDLANEPLVTTQNGDLQPFVLHNHKLYLQRYFSYETQILERLNEFAETSKLRLAENTTYLKKQDNFLRSLFPETAPGTGNLPEDKIHWQLVAAITVVLNDLTIITGGPGTGKTTTVARVLAVLYSINPHLKVALAAPTGKAAARMAESLKLASPDLPHAIQTRFETITPQTIHRLLKNKPGSPYFRFDRENPLNYDVVIVDESSMIDVALFAKLLNAIGPDTKLILLGDKDQLASVEAGSLFGDLCKSQSSFQVSPERGALINSFISDPFRQVTPNFLRQPDGKILFEHIVELKGSHRFRSDQGIGQFSKAVINGNMEQLHAFLSGNAGSQVQIDSKYDEEAFENFIKGYREYIREPDIKGALRKLNSLRVLCAVREGDQGLYSLNRRIEKYLQRSRLIKPASEFYEHRPVIVMKNHYDINLFNGDVGIMRYDEHGALKAWFEDSSGELKCVLPGFISEAETVFAMTIHKSQGSEYDRVLVMLPDVAELPLLTAELLYTAVTRAKSQVLIQGSEAVITEMVAKKVKRASGIAGRIAEAAGI